MSHNKELLQILIIVQNVGYLAFFVYICIVIAVSYTHLTLPTICSV